MLTLDKIYHAAFILKEVARKTDIIHATKLGSDNDLYLKTENLQRTGSFKLRGAYYKISQLTEEQKKAGIIACSAGNHAQGVALGATKQGVKSVVCMPASAPLSKIEATKNLGAEVVLVDGAYDDAYLKAKELQQKTGATMIHPFDDEDVIAGQGTVGVEILDEMPDADAIVVPIGGGGLISGVAYAAKQLRPNIKVYGVQAEKAPSMYKSIEKNAQITLDTVNTFADGIAVKHPGDLTFKMVQEYVDEIITVTEDEIATAILAMIESQKLVAEGAGAVSVAAAMFNKLPIKGKKVVCVVSGGNIDVNILSRVINRGLITSGRSSTLLISVEDRPGQLEKVCEVIASCGANIVSVHHERTERTGSISGCYIRTTLETRDFDHINQIKEALIKNGFIIKEK